MGVFATRGCKEDFVPNPELLNEGKVIFVNSAALLSWLLQSAFFLRCITCVFCKH